MISKKDIQAVLIIAAFYGLLHLMGITCPIRWLTGISCAGCGMTRAWLAVLRLDLSAAFFFHPLWWLVPFAVLALLFRHRLPRPLLRWGLGLICVLFLFVYVVRMLQPGDPVVTFAPETGLLYRVISGLTH